MTPAEINRFLSDFAASPAEVMDRVPDKLDGAGRARDEATTAFGDDDIMTGDFVGMRDGVRAGISGADDAGNVFTVGDMAEGKAPIERRDRAEDLVDEIRWRKPADIDAAGATSALLEVTPWSDDYWGIYLGLLGRRYADTLYPEADDWAENEAYVKRHPAAAIVASGRQDDIDKLSPSEKYDLLVGDAGFTLTGAMWDEGRRFHASKGSVETWMGICHGWAPASFMMARPRKVVSVRSPSGVLLRFFPADIRGLCSLLWANAPPPMRFAGSRCEDKDPRKDENGRVLSQAAFDNNPGTWHLAVTNQIGAAKRSFVMDATFDYEVWNQPVSGYEIHYFNPASMQFAGTARQATVARGDFKRDRFARYRSKDMKAVLGVAMRTRYVIEVRPTHAETNAPANDASTLVDYFYDLELDGEGNVLGGEWYLNRHPDFLWTPARGRRAVTPGDAFATGEWAVGAPVPATFREAAVRIAAEGMPLAKVVERLVALSSE